jgi:methanethiol oxidase
MVRPTRIETLTMTRMLPETALYDTPASTAVAPPEKLAYVALASTDPLGRPDALGVIDANTVSPTYGQLVRCVELPEGDNGAYRVDWDRPRSRPASSMPNESPQRRYLVMPGLRSGRHFVLDTQPDPMHPRLVRVDEADEAVLTTGHSARVAHEMILTRESEAESIIGDGLNAERLLAGGYDHRLHVWEIGMHRRVKTIDLGADQQVVLDLRPAHNPTRAYGFVATLLSCADLSSSVFLWYLDRGSGTPAGEWKARRVIAVPAEVATDSALPPLLRRFGAVPPLITGIDLSADDRFLYVSCWGTGELRQYDVSDPFNPALTGLVRLGGVTRRAPHPAVPHRPLNGGPHSMEVSRDGRRVYVTNSRSPLWDAQFYPDGVRGWVAKLDVGRGGGLSVDPRFFVETGVRVRPHGMRLG